jgi:hypothetical protein
MTWKIMDVMKGGCSGRLALVSSRYAAGLPSVDMLDEANKTEPYLGECGAANVD